MLRPIHTEGHPRRANMTTPDQPTPPSPGGPRIAADLTAMLYDLAIPGLVITLLNALLVATGLSFVADPAASWTWFGAVALVFLARVGLVLAHRARPEGATPATWELRFAAGAWVMGAVWGVAILIIPEEAIAYQVFLAFVLAGMVAGAIPSLSPYLPAYLGYQIAAVAPLAWRMAEIGGHLPWSMLVMVVLFSLFMATTARGYHRTLVRTLELGYANADLVASLTGEKARIEALNADLSREIAEREAVQQALVLAKEQAEAANLAKGQFVANMSHEIRTPMVGVLGMLDMLGDTGLSTEQAGLVEIARNSADGLLVIINDILDFAKIEAGKLDMESIPFDARTIAEEVATLFTAGAQSRRLDLTCFVAPQAQTRVIGDPTRLRQVLTNLMGNAIKFTHQGSVVLQASESPGAPGNGLRFDIRDTGIGMTQTQMAKLFMPFQQADGGTNRRYGGSGLGLAITKHLVELMGGRIAVESTPGAGSRFTLNIPFEPQPDQAAEPTPEPLRGTRMLAVDDNPVNLDVVGHYLRSWGVECDTAAGANEALDRLRQAAQAHRPFAVAVLDMQMPDVDGLALARLIKADSGIAATRLVLVSSMGPMTDACRAAGFDACLGKPIRQTVLRDVLLGVLAAAPAPLVPPLSPAQDRRVPEPRPTKPQGRILLAEDNPVNQKVALGMLRRLGLEADLVANGRAAVERATAKPYDLILMDVQMPEMDGFEATRALRRDPPPGSQIPIIAMTANAMSGDRERCLEAGMDDYLAKPVKLDQLRSMIERWMGGVRA